MESQKEKNEKIQRHDDRRWREKKNTMTYRHAHGSSHQLKHFAIYTIDVHWLLFILLLLLPIQHFQHFISRFFFISVNLWANAFAVNKNSTTIDVVEWSKKIIYLFVDDEESAWDFNIKNEQNRNKNEIINKINKNQITFVNGKKCKMSVNPR